MKNVIISQKSINRVLIDLDEKTRRKSSDRILVPKLSNF